MPQLSIINPYDQNQIGSIAYDDPSTVDAKLNAAVRAQMQWQKLALSERIARVREGVKRFEAAGEVIARDVTLQMGKPLSQAHGELKTVSARAQHMLEIAPQTLRPDLLPEKPGFERRIEHVPWGVVLHISAWNYPLIIPVNVVVPALVAGNVVVIKHSPLTPLCGQAFADAFGNLGVENLVTHLVLSNEATEALIDDPRINYVAFTGSVPSGRAVYKRAAARLMEAGLELGGKDPAYVAEDADLAFAIENVVDGACYNAGQSCCAIERVYVHKRHYNDFVEGVRAVIRNYRLGDPTNPETNMGPLARRAALGELESHVSDAVHRGARVLAGGKRAENVDGKAGNFFPPTLVVDVPNDSLLMQEESFGPTIPVAMVESDEDALKKMSETRFGLTASIWTRDQERAEHFAQNLQAGTIFQNRCDYLDPALPWTGFGESGKGSTLSTYGYLHLTRRKSIHFRTRTG